MEVFLICDTTHSGTNKTCSTAQSSPQSIVYLINIYSGLAFVNNIVNVPNVKAANKKDHSD